MPRLRVHQIRHFLESDVRVWRDGKKREALVYVLRQNRLHQYPEGRSRVIYIGTTHRGIDRILASLAYRTRQVVKKHGVKAIDVQLVTCTPRQNVRSWRKLENAFLLKFKDLYGDIPYCNANGHGLREVDEFALFSEATIGARLRELEN